MLGDPGTGSGDGLGVIGSTTGSGDGGGSCTGTTMAGSGAALAGTGFEKVFMVILKVRE